LIEAVQFSNAALKDLRRLDQQVAVKIVTDSCNFRLSFSRKEPRHPSDNQPSLGLKINMQVSVRLCEFIWKQKLVMLKD
jgi:hypothetical protein